MEHEDSWYSPDWLDSSDWLDSLTDESEVLVEVVVPVYNAEAAGCLMANTADGSKEMVVVQGVVVETLSDLKVVDSQLVQTR